MLFNFSLTFAAVTLRVYLPICFIAGLQFEVFYPAIAWLAWVPNVLVAALLVRRANTQPVVMGATVGRRAAGSGV